MQYFVANWKAEKNLKDCFAWVNLFSTLYKKYNNPNVQIIICPPIAFLASIKPLLQSSFPSIKFGSQDLSQFDNGKYTGEITAQMLNELVNFVIIGHSERRTNNNETDNHIRLKVEQAYQYGIKSIVCISESTQTIPEKTNIIAFEPLSAIASGNNYSVESVVHFKKSLNLPNTASFIYGGSVNKKNINTYLHNPEIDGFLIGTASLDPQEFFDLLPY